MKKDHHIWQQRPLPAQMLSYAAEDVSQLLTLAAIITSEMARLRSKCFLNSVKPMLNGTGILLTRTALRQLTLTGEHTGQRGIMLGFSLKSRRKA